MERARSVISDTDLRSGEGGRKEEGRQEREKMGKGNGGGEGLGVIRLTVKKGISLAGQLLPNKGRGI